MFRFLHAPTDHTEGALIGLDRYDSAAVQAMRGATRRAFENLSHLVIDEESTFVLVAGDLYGGEGWAYGTGLFFVD